MAAPRCIHCGGPILLADNGSRWLHMVGYDVRAQCPPTYATPSTYGGAS